MAAVDTWSLRTNLARSSGATGLRSSALAGVSDQVQTQVAEMVRDSFKREAWAWFAAHQDEPVITINFWIFKKEVVLRDLRPLWERVFGPEK